MKFDTPATSNPIDQLRVIGHPTQRIDGKLKTTGSAPYAYERHDVVANQAYGVVVGAAIAKGRIAAMHLHAARAAPGVIAIVTAETAGELGKGKHNTAKLLAGPDIEHYHQAVALVVAETFEQARAGAELVTVDYDRSAGLFDLSTQRPAAKADGEAKEQTVGDFETAFAAAPIQLDETYTTPDQTHAMMEPFATIAAWEGDRVDVWTSNQMIAWTHQDLATTLGMEPDKVRVMSPFIGGGFGGKLFLRADAVLAVLGARAANRPVKVAMTRPMMANNATHRPATIQRVQIGATADGTITAMGHQTWSGNLPGGRAETASEQTKLLYAGANRRIGTYVAELDLPEGNSMRAPGEAPGMMALEIAMDEMAEKLGLDPIEFRIINDTKVDPAHPERQFSQRQLVECLRTGAERFGWNERRKPGQRRDGRMMLGMGVAAGFRNNLLMKSGARVLLDEHGIVTVQTDMTDIGNGSYTILAQTAAEMMGVGLDQVVVQLGNSDYPVSSGSGGQFGANNSTSGVYAACVKLREAVAQKLGINSEDAVFQDGHVHA
ncbi:MAG: xanthine dehydrogenase family protein molybdopterin-binding subunit, partial [Pseudomonadota bacterium]|nr:xanthine dehydrogenase family protein molybdopterin-binding subunit [Pseudomonadota bacterium]